MPTPRCLRRTSYSVVCSRAHGIEKGNTLLWSVLFTRHLWNGLLPFLTHCRLPLHQFPFLPLNLLKLMILGHTVLKSSVCERGYCFILWGSRMLISCLRNSFSADRVNSPKRIETPNKAYYSLLVPFFLIVEQRSDYANGKSGSNFHSTTFWPYVEWHFD